MQRRGWFSIPGVQDGDRTLAQQLRGLAPMLEEARGKNVLDLGCAEGLIARECLAAGASAVMGMDSNPAFLEQAERLGLDPHRARFALSDLNKAPDADDLACCHSDIVLMLAILHKLRDPGRALQQWAQFAGRLLVIRLPRGSEGVIAYKHGREKTVDSRKLLQELGFTLERDEEGPNRERVHYWRRVA